jgi:hypothetical protein
MILGNDISISRMPARDKGNPNFRSLHIAYPIDSRFLANFYRIMAHGSVRVWEFAIQTIGKGPYDSATVRTDTPTVGL